MKNSSSNTSSTSSSKWYGYKLKMVGLCVFIFFINFKVTTLLHLTQLLLTQLLAFRASLNDILGRV